MIVHRLFKNKLRQYFDKNNLLQKINDLEEDKRITSKNKFCVLHIKKKKDHIFFIPTFNI